MHTVAIVSRKGGAGKTTIAVHLAVAAEQAGRRSAILDLDQQASAAGWADLRSSPRPEVRTCVPHRLSRELAAISHCDFAVIDTAPHAEGGALAAARAADLVVIPCRPAVFDLQALGAALDIARIAGTPTVAILNAIPPRGRAAEQARAILVDSGIDVAGPMLTHRQAFVHALARGEAACEFDPRSKASAEIVALHDAIANHRPRTARS